MVVNGIGGVPPWLLAGLALGALLSALAAGAFLAGERWFPGRTTGSGNETSSEKRRRGEIREYLSEIDERYVENHRIESDDVDEEVAFYLPERDVAVTFDAQVYLQLERTNTFAVLCEHEMPGNQLGRRLPFETPDLGPDPDPEPDDPRSSLPTNVAAALSVLDLEPDADVEAVEAAYRERIKEVHPDHGGDQEAFKAVQEAYTTAKRHAKRKARN